MRSAQTHSPHRWAVSGVRRGVIWRTVPAAEWITATSALKVSGSQTSMQSSLTGNVGPTSALTTLALVATTWRPS
jgi:hypothetical protein